MILCTLLLLFQNGWALGDEPEDRLWPIGDGVTPPRIYQSYGQAEVSGSVHLHAGLDLVPGTSDRTVWALEDGTVVRIDLDAAGGGKKAGLVVASKPKPKQPRRAFLYMHLDPDSIDLLVGDEVEVDEELGRVRAEDPGTAYEEHLHLSRLGGRFEDETIPWSMLETLSIRNPLVLIDHDLHEDQTGPELQLDEGKLFRRNESLGDPTLLASSAVKAPLMLDVLAQVRDFSNTSGPLAPHVIEILVWTGTRKDKFGLILDGPLPLSSDVLYDEKNCTSSACSFIVTNGSPASSSMDKLHAWCASAGPHRLELTARDAAGNVSNKLELDIEIPP